MLTIYGCFRSRASRNIWLAYELGVDFKHIPVIQAGRLADPLATNAPINTKSPEFLKVNPNGLIPAMEMDGLVLAESLAINLFMAKKFGGDLAPRDLNEDALITQWAIWAMTEAEIHTIQVLYHKVMFPEASRDPARLAEAVAALARPFRVLDEALAATGWLVGGRFTVADLNMAEVIRYAQPVPELFEAAPRVKAWLAACQARPAFQKMVAGRNAEPA
ncbi:glutathione S-transferase family protein [Roseococcus thiosulfatophilus]|uniref:glutathione S-transferase family protein n=1 Tax=Roseococcus thiosulfatophilus TaxID=35813 RepID=UPI001A8F5242|nr:glutathione S-transferase family protein [Roseococcus thiosulfatophilus]